MSSESSKEYEAIVRQTESRHSSQDLWRGLFQRRFFRQPRDSHVSTGL